jgi:hypothetical protein
MIASDDELAARLRAIESSEWVPDRRRRARGRVMPVALASLVLGLVLGVGAGFATAASVVVRTDVHVAEGAFNKGQPLYCSGVELMTPREADQWLRDRGYTPEWQTDHFPGGPKVSETPPDEGMIVNGAFVDARTIHMGVVPVGYFERNGPMNCP